jgi:hypothetical protein
MRCELAPEPAVAAIGDWLDTMNCRGCWENRPDFADAMRGGGQILHLHATDAPGEWLARREPDMVVLERTHTKADVVVRGPAANGMRDMIVNDFARPLEGMRTLVIRGGS